MVAKRHIFKLVSGLLTVGALVFGFRYFTRLVNEIDLSSLQVDHRLIVASAVLFIAFYALLSLHWNRICRRIGGKEQKQQLSFLASQPYKYLPTSLFTFSFRAKYAKRLGMSVKQSSLAQLIENFNMLSTGLLVGAVFYLLNTGLYLILGSVFILVVAGAVLIPSKISVGLKSKRITIIKKEQLADMAVAAAAWLVSGISFYVLAHGMTMEIGLHEALSANALAYVLGIFAFFAPGGIGVREWVFALFGIPNVPIVAWRILTFTADMVLGFSGVIAVYRNRKLR